MVYLYGSSGSYLMWQKYDPNLDAIVDGGKYDAGSTLPGYKFYSGFCAISSTFSESNNRILILSACSSDIQLHLDPQDSQDYIKASLRVVSHNINDKQLSVGAFGYGSEFATTVHPYTGLPADKPLSNIFYSYLDKKVYMFSSYLTPNLMVLDPSTLFIATQNSVYWQGGNSPVLPTSSFTTCEINNSLFISSYDYQQQIGDIHQIDLNTRTGSRVINGHSPSYQPSGFLGAYTTNLAYVTGRSAVIAVGNVVSYLINPFEAHAGKTTQSIIEYIPQIYNAADAIYCPRNAAIIISGTDAVYNFQGALQASVVNALMNLDTLKAGATASGDVCTIQIAKPSGSFTSGFTYEGMNVRVDNASSLTTASLILGARDGGNNLQLSSSVVTWGNSQQTAVRSIFSYQNAGTAKWTADQFKNLQFYMQAGPEV